MKILKCNFSNGLIMPVLVYKDNSCPVFLPYVYSILQLRGKSYQTSYVSMVSIKFLYTYFDSLDMNFEEMSISGDFDPIFEKLDYLVHALYTGQNLPGTVSNHLFDSYLRSLNGFLKWIITRYDKQYADNRLAIIEDKFSSSMLHKPLFPTDYKSMEDQTVETLRTIINPNSERNPFRHGNRLRNWLVTEIFIHTGIRSGELLNLKVPDIYKNGDNYYLRIRQSSDEEIIADSRWKKPSIKNSYSIRTVALPKTLYIAFERYLKDRRKGKNINHSYLFVSERGRPLSLGMLTELFRRLKIELNKSTSETVDLTAHILRHTFVEKMLCYLLEIRLLDMERAKDELRNICGWSITSPMPNYYSRRYIAKLANKHNLERIEYSLNS